MSIKGQTAIEFMMTYGWAALIAMSAIGALVYFAPNAKTMTTSRCAFGSELQCIGISMDDISLKIVLTNGVGHTIYNVTAFVTNPTALVCNTSKTMLSSNDKLTVQCMNSGGLNLTKDTRIGMTINYKKVNGGFTQSSIGDIFAKYQKCVGFVLYRHTDGGDNTADKACCATNNMCVYGGTCYNQTTNMCFVEDGTHCPSDFIHQCTPGPIWFTAA